MTNTKDDFFVEENEASTNWEKFETVGDKIKGELVRTDYKEAEGNFKPQFIYVILTEEGEEINVPISENKKMVVNAMKSAVVGQMVGFVREEDYITDEMKKKGFAPAHSIKCYKGPKPVQADNIVTEETTVDELFGK